MAFFVIRGNGEKKDTGGKRVDFDRVDNELIEPAIEKTGLIGGTTAREERENLQSLVRLATRGRVIVDKQMNAAFFPKAFDAGARLDTRGRRGKRRRTGAAAVRKKSPDQ